MSKKFAITITLTFEIEIPDEHPGDALHIALMLEWKENNYCDGRYPLSRELMTMAATQAIQSVIEESPSRNILTST